MWWKGSNSSDSAFRNLSSQRYTSGVQQSFFDPSITGWPEQWWHNSSSSTVSVLAWILSWSASSSQTNTSAKQRSNPWCMPSSSNWNLQFWPSWWVWPRLHLLKEVDGSEEPATSPRTKAIMLMHLMIWTNLAQPRLDSGHVRTLWAASQAVPRWIFFQLTEAVGFSRLNILRSSAKLARRTAPLDTIYRLQPRLPFPIKGFYRGISWEPLKSTFHRARLEALITTLGRGGGALAKAKWQ